MTTSATTVIDAIFYDLDGVLIDTKDWHYDALNEALADFGFTITPQEQEAIYEGLPTQEKLRLLSQHKGLPTGLHFDITAIKNIKLLENFTQHHKIDTQKITLIQKMRDHGIKQVLCSNTTQSTVELMLKAAGLYDYFDHIITRQDITYPKPHPEIYLTAMVKTRATALQCLILEDSVHGIQAATQSGANVMKVDDVASVTYDNVLRELERYR